MAILGSATNLVAGTGTYTLMTPVGYWFIQNQDVAPLKVAFTTTTGSTVISNRILAAATALGGSGETITSLQFPYLDPVGMTLTSTVATAQFGSGCFIADPYAQQKGISSR